MLSKPHVIIIAIMTDERMRKGESLDSILKSYTRLSEDEKAQVRAEVEQPS